MYFQGKCLILINSRCDTTMKRVLQNNRKLLCIQKLFSCFTQAKTFSTRNENKLIVRSPYPDIEIPNKTFLELIWERHNKWKNHTAVECGVSGQRYSYSALLEKSENVGRGLINQGLRPRDVLVFVLPNMPEFLIGALGAGREGLTICTLNPLLTPDEVAEIIKNSHAKCIITSPDKLEDISKAIGNITVHTGCKPIKIIVTRGSDGTERALPPDIKSFSEVEASGKTKMSDHSLAPLQNPKDCKAIIAFTSGTTGLPKAVCLSSRNITSSMLLKSVKTMGLFKETTVSHQEVIPMLLPIFHLFGFDFVLASLLHGTKVVLLPGFEPQTFLSTLKNHKVTMLALSPHTVSFLASNPEVSRGHLTHLRCVISGGASISEEEIIKFVKKTPSHTNFRQGYGLTETLSVTFTPEGMLNYKTIGVPCANTEIKVMDIENGSLKKAFQEGEILVRGPQISQGYLNNINATEKLIDIEGWFHTGDMGYYDNEGCFYIVGRIKEMIKVKAFQVSPTELETVLRKHPGIEDAGVTSKPHERKGEEPVGFIKVKKDVKVCEKELKLYIQRRVAPFKMISQFIFVDAIPRNSGGKILRRELKKKLTEI